MKQLTYTIALMLVLVGSAFAQRVQTNPTAQSDGGGFWSGFSFNEEMGGVEVSPGTVDFVGDVTWGKTIVMHGASSDFTANINSGGVKPDLQYGNKIIGGTWTLTVYKDGVFQGMLFGVFTSGNLKYNSDKAGNVINEFINADMLIKGGTDALANVGGAQTSGKFLSTSYMNANTGINETMESSSPAHKGEVILTF